MTPQNEWRDKVIKETAEQLNQPEDLVAIIVKNQWVKAKKAIKLVNQVDLPGLGKFSVKIGKIEKLLPKFEYFLSSFKRKQAATTDPMLLHGAAKKVNEMQENVDNLKNRLSKLLASENKS